MLELVVGPMRSGKSKYLLDRIQTGRETVVAVPVGTERGFFTRDTTGETLLNLDGLQLVTFVRPQELLGWSRFDLVLVDEVQLVPDGEGLLEALRLLSTRTAVIAAGLDLDANGVPFGTVAALQAVADTVTVLTADCRCGRVASRTRRLTPWAGSPVGDADYEPTCDGCWRPVPVSDGG